MSDRLLASGAVRAIVGKYPLRMDWRIVPGLLSGAVAFGATVPYFVATRRGEIRPNPLAWSGWALLSGIVFLAQILAEPSWSAVIAADGFLCCATVAVLAVRVSGLHPTPLDIVCALFGVVAIVAWQITRDPQIALAVAIAASLILSLPMLLKTIRDPDSEPGRVFLFFVAASVLSMLSASRWDFLSLGWPLTYVAFDGTIAVIALRTGATRRPSRRKLRQSKLILPPSDDRK